MKVEQDRQILVDAQQRGTLPTVGAYVRLSGPGWLQSAITLGGGSLASSLYLGVLAGFSMLWLQPLAMVLGIIMLSAIGYVTLSTGERPFQAINRHINPVLGWSWALASLVASMVWCLPQYSLATGVLQQNLVPNLLGPESYLGDFYAKLIIVIAVFIITTAVTWSYDTGSWGVRMYERVLKLMVAMIVLCFIGVVIRITVNGALDWGAIVAGFTPDFSLLHQPAPGFRELIADIPGAFQPLWADMIVREQRDVMISAAATAVGINMTFLLPYTLLRRGWGREFRGLLRFDLSTGMFIPFVMATSCVIIASASQFHPGARADSILTRHQEKLQLKEEGTLTDEQASALQKETAALETARQQKLQFEMKEQGQTLSEEEKKQRLEETTLTDTEKTLVLSLIRRDAMDLARSLEPLTGRLIADIIFGLGVLGMTLSTITILMLISGLVISEMLNLPTTGWPYRLGCLAAATGVLGPFLWASIPRFYLAVPASVFGMTLLPLAYLTFFCMMNQRSLLGEDMPRGGRRIAWNLLMGIAATVATLASVWVIWQNAQWFGIAGVVGLLALALIVHFARSGKAAK